MGIKHLSRVRINGHVLRPKTGTIPTVALPAYFTCSIHKISVRQRFCKFRPLPEGRNIHNKRVGSPSPGDLREVRIS